MKRPKKVTLLNPAPSPPVHPWRGAPLAVLSASSFLEKQGYDIRIITDFLYRDFEKQVLEHCADSVCLGISAFSGYQIFEGLRVARMVRTTYPGLPIVWGGWHPSMLPEQTAADPNVDIVVRGQGERAFAELVDALYEGRLLADIQGLVWKDRDSIRVNAPRPIEDIDHFPPVPYHLVDVERCLVKTDFGQRGLMYLSSYGCPHRCSFCIEPILNHRIWTSLEADRVVTEWEYLVKKYNLDSIILEDSNFFVDKKRVYRICSELVHRNIRIKIVGANGRISQLVKYEPEIWEVMQRAGLASILTGAESGDQDSLDLLQKDTMVEQNIEFTKLCARYGIHIRFSYLIGSPWSDDPMENAKYVEKEYRATISQMNELIKISDKNRFLWFIYTPYPGSLLFQRAVQLGFRPPTSLEGWSTVVLTSATAQERGWITSDQMRRTLMINNYVWELMDRHTYERVRARVRNKIARLVYSVVYPIAAALARVRWKFKLFGLPIDYWLFLQARKHLGMGKESD
jgi:anaerobic magnesium-protoporphyrin IX monomethyl ester cyclase